MAATTKWICPSCTYYNYSSVARCTICSCTKPADLHPVTRPSAVYPRQKNHYSGGSGLSRGPISSASSGHFTSCGAGISSDMIIHPDSCFSRYRPTSIALGQQVEGTGRERGDHQSGSPGGQSKWVCSMCTYSNWPNSHHCTMCTTPRAGRHNKPSLPAGGANKEGGRIGSAGVGSILDYAPRCIGAVGGASHTQQQDDARLSSHAKELSNRLQKSKSHKKSLAENRVQKKWKCHNCTYENWARAGKCVMCQTPRNKTPSPPISDSEGSQSPNHSHTHAHTRLSPSSSSSSSLVPTDNANTSPSFSHSRGLGVNSNEATAPPVRADATHSAFKLIPCVSEDTDEIYPSMKLSSTSDEVRQIRNRLSSSDWYFINACLGVVNEDEGAVKTYLRHEGDRARQLTSDECLVLGQPSTFTVGCTLVHLAIRLISVHVCIIVYTQPGFYTELFLLRKEGDVVRLRTLNIVEQKYNKATVPLQFV